MSFLVDLLAATLRNATPLVYGTVGETYTERAGVLNLGIEGTMYAGAFFGFAVAFATGSPLLGLGAAILVGLLAGAIMALLTVTLGANQHVSGIGLTIGLIGASEFVNRLVFTGQEAKRITPFPTLEAPAALGPLAPLFSQYALTWVAFLVVVPLAWWLLHRTTFGLEVRAVGEDPEAADAAGIDVFRTRYLALMLGGALMAVGGAFFTLALLGTFTLDIIAGRGWVCIALVIFGRWRIFRGVLGALLFAAVFSLQFRLRILPGWDSIPFELLLALPYLVVILALAISGRNVAYPGAYLKPYRRT
ncbi:MAG TPA: ABC transporter permease [Candidatus Limnocylindrales bacterium]|nr:ABC transporter permease [Candidatus Limnocylindrales bacterium]